MEKINIDLKKKTKRVGISLAGVGVALELMESGLEVVDVFIPKEKSKTIETSLGNKKTTDIVKIQFKDMDENEYVKFMYLVENIKENEKNYDVYRGITDYSLIYEFSETNNNGVVYNETTPSSGFREVVSDSHVNSVSIFDDYDRTLDEVKAIENAEYKEKKQEDNYSNIMNDYNDAFNYYMKILGGTVSEEDYQNSMDYLEQNGFFDSLGNSADILNSVYGEYGSYFGFVEEETETPSR